MFLSQIIYKSVPWLLSIALRTKVLALILRCFGAPIAWKATFAKLLSCLTVNSTVPLSATTIIGNTAVIMSIYMEKTIAASPSNTILFGLADRDVGVSFLVQPLYVIYQSFYFASRKQTWLILMKAFNILSNLLYSISFPTIATVSVDRISRDLSTLTLPGTCHHSSYCLSLRCSEAHRSLVRFDADWFYHRSLHGNYCRMYCKIFTVPQRHQRKIHKQKTNEELRALPQQRKSALNMFYVCLFYEMVMLPLKSRI